MIGDDRLDALRTSVERLRRLVEPMDDEGITAPAYPSEWTIAQVLSHLGSGAVITRRSLDDVIAGTPTPEAFTPSVWDAWNAKSPRAQADDALAADAELMTRLQTVTDDERSRFSFSLGPLTLDFEGFVGLRLNEHALHTWDIQVAGDPDAILPPDLAALVVDNLELIAGFTAKGGEAATIAIHTTDPDRDFTVEVTPERATLTPGGTGTDADVTLPAEAFARLVYGRFGDPAPGLDALRRTFPGP